MYIARINSEGQIISLSIPQGANNPAEGYLESEDVTIVYIGFDIDNRPHFMEHNYYDYDTQSFTERPAKPNPAAKWKNKEWVWDQEDFLNLVRRVRASKLYETDWVMLPDNRLADWQKEETSIYRQRLRDIIDHCHNLSRLEDVPWPPKPFFL